MGCSKLRNHMSKRNLRNCTKCDLNVPETNEHYFEICNMYQPQRRILKKDIDNVLKLMDMDFNTVTFLGMNPKIMKSKKRMKNNKIWLMMIYKSVLTFMKNTQRFT